MKKAIESILQLKDPLTMFDMICAMNYFAGQSGQKMPVEESRKVYEKILKLSEE